MWYRAVEQRLVGSASASTLVTAVAEVMVPEVAEGVEVEVVLEKASAVTVLPKREEAPRTRRVLSCVILISGTYMGSRRRRRWEGSIKMG